MNLVTSETVSYETNLGHLADDAPRHLTSQKITHILADHGQRWSDVEYDARHGDVTARRLLTAKRHGTARRKDVETYLGY